MVENHWSRVVEVGKNYFKKYPTSADLLLADCDCLCHEKVRKRQTLLFTQGLSLTKCADTRCGGID